MKEVTAPRVPLSAALGMVLVAGVLIAPLALPSDAADGATTVGLVDTSSGRWFLYDESGNLQKDFYYGNPGDFPLMGDWDCDGDDTPGQYRQSDGFVYVRNDNSSGIADRQFFLGNPGDVPLAGDFNNDGCDTVSIYRPSNQQFYIANKLSANNQGIVADYSFEFGDPGDKPVVGDWDGDGIDEIGLHRETTGLFYWRNTLTTGNASGQIIFGDPGDRFVAGDWGIVDGADTPSLFRPSNTTMFFRHTLTQGNADSQFIAGESGWVPVAGKFGAGGTGTTTTTSSTSTPSTSTTSTTTSTTTTTTSTTTTMPEPTCAGDFASFVVSGSGDDVVPLTAPGDVRAVLTLGYVSASNFIVHSLDTNFTIIDFLVNEIGAYHGTVPVNHWDSDGKIRWLEVTASGPWEAVVSSFCDLRSLSNGFIGGAGPDVVLVNRSGPAELTYSGTSNFSVWSYQSSTDRDLEANEIGAYIGTVLMDPGTEFLEIKARANDAWTVTYQ